MKQERFYPPEIIRDPTAKIKHFKAENADRDRFGNRLFASPNLAYVDAGGDKVKAALLMSKEGQQFIEQNKGILKDIEWGLSILETPNRDARESSVDLSEGRILDIVSAGGQSNFYVLTINGEKFAIKTHVKKREDREELHQPYVNEMLQTQSVAADLKDKLLQLKVKMATFLFASGQVSCSRYESGVQPDASKLATLNHLEGLLERYIYNQQEKGDTLWENTDLDIPAHAIDQINTLKNNFKQKPDGTLVWIDPFVYFRPEPSEEK